MKKTRNLVMLMVLMLSIGLISCDEQTQPEDTTPQQEVNAARSRLARVNNGVLNTTNIADWQGVDPSTLPQNIQDYLNDKYPSIGLLELWMTDTGEYVILLENDIVAIFNASGELILAFDLGEVLADLDGNGDDMPDWDEVDLADVPQCVLDYIATNYPDANIEMVGKHPESGDYMVVLDNGFCVFFNKDCEFLEEVDERDPDDQWEEIDITELPQSILDYIAANYADASIEEAGKNTETGEYIVALDNGLILIFDLDGNFLEEYDEEDEFDEEGWDDLEAGSLPQIILDYVSSNYTDATIEGAALNEDDGRYLVFLDNGLVLEFDADGQFLEEHDWDEEYEDCIEVEIEDLPEAIRNYVGENYADNIIEEAYYDEMESLYYIVLDNDTVLVFDADGNFIKEETDG